MMKKLPLSINFHIFLFNLNISNINNNKNWWKDNSSKTTILQINLISHILYAKINGIFYTSFQISSQTKILPLKISERWPLSIISTPIMFSIYNFQFVTQAVLNSKYKQNFKNEFGSRSTNHSTKVRSYKQMALY